jgi:DNA-binding transcriptional LysR family regulator
MELRQIRYLVTVAEELHFGRAAAREHIVQSAVSQQVKRLERELGVSLLERDTHHVKLTAAGSAFVVEARQILAQTERAASVARAVAGSLPELRVGILDASYDSMPQILAQVQASNPGLVIHQVEASEPEQHAMLADGRLDVGIGHRALAPKALVSRLFRRDLLGILVPDGHRFCGLDRVRIADLTREMLLFSADARDPGLNQFVAEICRSAGFAPAVHAGTVMSIRAAGELVAQGRCVSCLPFSCTRALPGTTWRPLTEPVSYYPWSILWRTGDVSDQVKAVLIRAQAMARHLGWLDRRR